MRTLSVEIALREHFAAARARLEVRRKFAYQCKQIAQKHGVVMLVVLLGMKWRTRAAGGHAAGFEGVGVARAKAKLFARAQVLEPSAAAASAQPPACPTLDPPFYRRWSPQSHFQLLHLSSTAGTTATTTTASSSEDVASDASTAHPRASSPGGRLHLLGAQFAARGRVASFRDEASRARSPTDSPKRILSNDWLDKAARIHHTPYKASWKKTKAVSE